MPVALFVTGWFFAATIFGIAMNGDYRIIGEPLILLYGKPIYNPVYFLFGIFKYIYYPQFQPYYMASMSYVLWFSLAALLFVIIWNIATGIMFKRTENLHGTARFAKTADLRKNGMLKNAGVVCGQLNDAKIDANRKKNTGVSMKQFFRSRLICHSGDVNTLLCMGTGEGKGISVIIPTILYYPHSMIIFDPKEENYNITAGYRRTMSRVLKFAPCSKNTLRFNPVQSIRDGDEYAFRDADLVVSKFFTPSKGGQDATSEYFNENAKSLFTGAMLHIRFSDYKDKSIAGISHFLVHTDFSTLSTNMGGDEGSKDQGKEQCMDMLTTKHFYTVTQKMFEDNKEEYEKTGIRIGDRIPAPYIDTVVQEAAMKALNTNVKEKATVYSTINAKLRLFSDKMLADATSESDFEIEDFINSPDPITLYLCVPYSDIARIAPVFNLLISFMLNKFSEGATKHGAVRLKNDVLFLLDEFPVLGYFPQIAENMGVLRGYGVHFLIVCQALSQLVERYGQNHPFLDHCVVKVYGSPGSLPDAQSISQTIGNESVQQGKVSRNSRHNFTQSSNLSFSENDFGRALLDPADLMRLPSSDFLIQVKGMQPYLAKKVVYYKDSRFTQRYKPYEEYSPETIKEIRREAKALPSFIEKKEMLKRLQEAMQNVREYNCGEDAEWDSELFDMDEAEWNYATETNEPIDSEEEIFEPVEEADFV